MVRWCSARIAMPALLALALASCGAVDDDAEGSAGADASGSEVSRDGAPAELGAAGPVRERVQRRERAGSEVTAASRSLSEGTVLRLTLAERVSTASHRAGDAFRARVAQAVRDEAGRRLVPEGAGVTGVVTESHGADELQGSAVLGLALRSIEVGGRSLPLRATVQQARFPRPEDGAMARIAIGSAADALIGRAIAERADDADPRLRNVAVAPTDIALTARGDAVLPAGSRIRIQLAAPVRGLPEAE